MSSMVMQRSALARAFTLVELIAVVVCLAILSGIAIPRFVDYNARNQDEACKGSLAGMRTAIAHFYANSANDGASPRWPTLKELQTPGIVMQDRVPPNPFLLNAEIASVIIPGVWPAEGAPPVEETPTGGWRYDASAGRIWANTALRPATNGDGRENTW